MREQIAKSVFWIIWSRGGIQVLSFLSTLFVARLLDPSDYGLMALATIWTSILALVSEMGLGQAIIQFRDLSLEELNASFWLTFGLGVLFYFVIYLAAPSIEMWFETDRLANVLRVVSITLPLTVMRLVPEGLLRKRLLLDKVSQGEIVSVLVSVPVMMGMAWGGAGVWALVAGAIILPLVLGAVIFFHSGWYPGLKMGGSQLPSVLRYSLATLGSRLAWATYQQADRLVLGKITGEVALGLYSMAKEVAVNPVTKVSAMVNQLASPVMAELQGNPDKMRLAFLRGLGIVACVTFPLCIGLMLTAEDVVYIALSEKWAPIVPYLQIFCLFSIIRCMDLLLPPILYARYRANFVFGYSLGLLICLPLGFYVGATVWGVLGVVYVWVLIYPLIMSWMAREAFKEINLGWKNVWGQLSTPMFGCLVMGLVVWGLQFVFPAVSFWDRLFRISVVATVGGITYGTCVILIGGSAVRDMQMVLSWVLRPTGSPYSNSSIRT